MRVWIDTLIGLQAASNGSDLISLMTGTSSGESRFNQMTLLRTIVGIDIARSVHDSGEGSEVVSVAIGIGSQEAFAANTLPDPQTSTDFPTKGWIWRARYRSWGFGVNQPEIFVRRVDLDLRSMRKLENGEAYFTVFNTPQEGTAGQIDVTGLVRQLWLVS